MCVLLFLNGIWWGGFFIWSVLSVMSRFRCDSPSWAAPGPDGLSALHHLQPKREISLPQPGAGSRESLPPSERCLYPRVLFSARTDFSFLSYSLQENRSMQQTMQALQAELDSLRADNIKLYEKIKFLQSYPGRVRVWMCSQHFLHSCWYSGAWNPKKICLFSLPCRPEEVMTPWCATPPSMRRDWIHLLPLARGYRLGDKHVFLNSSFFDSSLF